MTARIDNAFALAPDAIKAMYALEGAIKHSGLEASLLHLVKMRASQINHCAFCIEMHSREARAQGESELRLYMLSAWRESPLFTERERAALTWTESLTLVADSNATDADFAVVDAAFTQAEIVYLSMAIAAINAWNRLQVGFRAPHA